MDYGVLENEAEGICIIKASGLMRRPGDSHLLQNVLVDLIKSKGFYRFVIDVREAEIEGGTLDAFQVGTRRLADLSTVARTKTALLYAELTPEARFIENVMVNRGYQLRVFSDEKEAMAWLGKEV
jgi:hypothetical protein